MICPKCKKEISDNTLKCPHCAVRISVLCKKCKAINPVYSENCLNCSEPLLKFCPSCNSANFPEALQCRKCGVSFVQKVFETPIEPVYEDGLYTQQRAKNELVKGLSDETIKVISLSGGSGIGKTLVLRFAAGEMAENIVWLYGKCTPLTKLTPCGLIQDILLTFFNISDSCSDMLRLKKDSFKFFHQEFPALTNNEIFDLLNFLYPTNSDYFENINNNRIKTFEFLQKVFDKITELNKTVFVVDNFDNIDGMSYEFIHLVLKSDNFIANGKFLLTYNEKKPSRGYLYIPAMEDDSYFDISIAPLSAEQMSAFVDQYSETSAGLGEAFRANIYAQCGGNPAYLEQILNLLSDCARNKEGARVPNSFNEVIRARMEFVKKENPAVHEVLVAASILGVKFYSAVLPLLVNMEDEAFIQVMQVLVQLNFIVPVNENAFEFKNTMVWDSVINYASTSQEFSFINEKLYSILSQNKLSSNSLNAIIAQNLGQNLTALNVWTENTKLASYVGDTSLYVISQKQSLALVEKLDGVNNSLIVNNIYERLGKLLTKANPTEAMEYLPKAILNVQKMQDPLKEIELAGYLADCCMHTGNYYGAVECINSAIGKLDESFDLEIALLKSRLVPPLMKIGNSGQITNLIDNEIMPVFEKYLDTAHPHKNVSIAVLYEEWLKTHLKLAWALVYQGDSRAFEVVSSLFEIYEKNEVTNELLICKTKLVLAFANTIKGDVSASEEILEEILKLYRMHTMDNESVSQWNLINIINHFIQKNYSGLREELFQVVTFANNINDNFTKNILKTLLGKIFKDEDQAKRAMDIYAEQITYFAKEKIALGALLSWYLIADASLIIDGPDKSLEVARQALDVAQSPKINNYYFITLFNKIIAEAYMALSDFESAKIHIEKAILVARKFEISYLLGELYLLYGKYLQDLALPVTDLRADYVVGASKMYKKAYTIGQATKNDCLSKNIEKAIAVLNSFCQLNGITLK